MLPSNVLFVGWIHPFLTRCFGLSGCVLSVCACFIPFLRSSADFLFKNPAVVFRFGSTFCFWDFKKWVFSRKALFFHFSDPNRPGKVLKIWVNAIENKSTFRMWHSKHRCKNGEIRQCRIRPLKFHSIEKLDIIWYSIKVQWVYYIPYIYAVYYIPYKYYIPYIYACKLGTPFKHGSRCALFSLLSFVTKNSAPQREAQRMSCLKGVQRLHVFMKSSLYYRFSDLSNEKVFKIVINTSFTTNCLPSGLSWFFIRWVSPWGGKNKRGPCISINERCSTWWFYIWTFGRSQKLF